MNVIVLLFIHNGNIPSEFDNCCLCCKHVVLLYAVCGIVDGDVVNLLFLIREISQMHIAKGQKVTATQRAG